MGGAPGMLAEWMRAACARQRAAIRGYTRLRAAARGYYTRLCVAMRGYARLYAAARGCALLRGTARDYARPCQFMRGPAAPARRVGPPTPFGLRPPIAAAVFKWLRAKIKMGPRACSHVSAKEEASKGIMDTSFCAARSEYLATLLTAAALKM